MRSPSRPSLANRRAATKTASDSRKQRARLVHIGLQTLASVVLLGALAACEGTGLPRTIAKSSYPAGPYGEEDPQVGQVIENLTLRGALNLEGGPTAELDIADYTMGELRATGKSHVLIITATAWCPSCQNTATELGIDLGPSVREAAEAGGLVMELLTENTDKEPPSDNELLLWADRFEFTASVMSPTDDRLVEVFARREYGYVIELSSMEVIFNSGSRLFADPTVARVGVDALREVLDLPPAPPRPRDPEPETPEMDGGVGDGGVEN